jgi:hypothetical protein
MTSRTGMSMLCRSRVCACSWKILSTAPSRGGVLAIEETGNRNAGHTTADASHR